ncbi:MAG TPA: hypothetical protein PLQ56_03475 [Aggregatilineales bacterium]|nr:hypothetical protein [Aggregatilineales bacterium]
MKDVRERADVCLTATIFQHLDEGSATPMAVATGMKRLGNVLQSQAVFQQ